MSTSNDTRRRTPLTMDAEAFRAAGHALVDRIAERLAAIPRNPVGRDAAPSALRDALGIGGPLPEKGGDADALLERATRLLFEHSLFNQHPRFFGYITAPPAPVGILGDFLASALNANCGAWRLSPAATEVESETVRWIAELIGYPGDCGGILVSGGNMANFVCFFAARTTCAGWDIRRDGMAAGPKLRIYGSAETHTWISKAADLAGMGTDAIRWIPTDEHLRMDVVALEKQIEADRTAGERPFMVVGTGGSVSTGAVDPLPAIRDLCRRHELWFHVDGAYGGFAAASPLAPDDLRALRDADSVAVDPHKWLYAPLEAGCALVRDVNALRATFSYHPLYYHFEEMGTNYMDMGMQNSRGFRALKVWLQLQHAGASGYREMISEDIRLSRALADAVRGHAELELATQDLSITTFRFVPADLRPRTGEPEVAAYLNELNEALLDRTQREGEAFVSNAVIQGRYVLRACIVNFHTNQADIAALPGIFVRVGHSLDADMRPAALKV